MPRYRLCIGVDFGVSTSGVSYYLLGPREDLSKPPRSIPLHLTREELQPSVLGINGDNEDDDPNSWGTGITEGTRTLRLFKLALLHLHDLPQDKELPDSISFVRQCLDEITNMRKRDIDVVGKYLARLWADAHNVLGELVGNRGIAAGDIDYCFMFGHPAVWLEETTGRMRRAIEESKMTLVRGKMASWGFIDEPEAAALAAIPTQLERPNCPLKVGAPPTSISIPISMSQLGDLVSPFGRRAGLEWAELTRFLGQNGDTVVIADLGGGTVDFISYEITTLAPLRVRECVAGEGRLLGDMFMRRVLYSFVKKEAERARGAALKMNDLGQIDAEVENLWLELRLINAETLSNTTRSLNILLSDGTHLSVLLQGDDIVRELRKITNGIMELAEKQVSAAREKTGRKPAMILVVGGFGCNKFLQAEMVLRFGSRVRFTNEQGRLAVKTGAVIACVKMYGGDVGMLPRTAPMEVTYLSPRSYGFWDGTSPEGEIDWFITKGGDMPVTVTVPPQAFGGRTVGGYPSAPIYGVSTPLESVVALRNIKRVVGQPWQIICEKPEILRRDPPQRLELVLEMEGKVVIPKMFVDVQEDKGVYFRLRNW
ncbi:hypothetical protein B0I37DRAFT_402720 [Chaetomium sp. MPI-CAGE-AT-0009]|nr:hypothetical protein B0I37DRAFT_402720 [Chaetomium sp. MPI-CAGE-AT-0009]